MKKIISIITLLCLLILPLSLFLIYAAEDYSSKIKDGDISNLPDDEQRTVLIQLSGPVNSDDEYNAFQDKVIAEAEAELGYGIDDITAQPLNNIDSEKERLFIEKCKQIAKNKIDIFYKDVINSLNIDAIISEYYVGQQKRIKIQTTIGKIKEIAQSEYVIAIAILPTDATAGATEEQTSFPQPSGGDEPAGPDSAGSTGSYSGGSSGLIGKLVDNIKYLISLGWQEKVKDAKTGGTGSMNSYSGYDGRQESGAFTPAPTTKNITPTKAKQDSKKSNLVPTTTKKSNTAGGKVNPAYNNQHPAFTNPPVIINPNKSVPNPPTDAGTVTVAIITAITACGVLLITSKKK